MKFKLSHFGLIAILMTTFTSHSFAGIKSELFGYKLGETCKKASTSNDDVVVKLSCTNHTNKIWKVNVKLKSIDYDTLYEKTISSIGSPPTEQTPNEKSSCYSDEWYQTMGSLMGKKLDSNFPDKWALQGQSLWETVTRTSNGSEPIYSLRISSVVSYDCPYSAEYIDFESQITLTGNEIRHESQKIKEQTQQEQKNNTLNKLFN